MACCGCLARNLSIPVHCMTLVTIESDQARISWQIGCLVRCIQALETGDALLDTIRADFDQQAFHSALEKIWVVGRCVVGRCGAGHLSRGIRVAWPLPAYWQPGPHWHTSSLAMATMVI